ncbi:MAG: hypothetical protein COB02_02850 [Candidatus Cloacimonadota bacterium]|nr:MAG: hypothetical protein COB02_02850 [Candidatus Cloacimonadota bacterium]
MKLQLNFFNLVCILCLSQNFYAGIQDYLEPAKIKQKIKEEVASLDIGFDVKLLDLKAFEALGISSKYKYEVEPSYQDNYYTRIDKWNLNFSLRPGNFVKDLDLPISLNIDSGSEILFVRQFKSQKEALLAKPYTPKKIPFKAKWALKNLNVGDFVAIPAKLNIAINASVGSNSGVFSGGVYTQYLLSGEFQIHLFRMANDKMRMRLIAHRKKTISGGVDLKADFKIFGMSLVDKQIKKLIDLNLLKMGISKEQGDLFMFDYIFDLKNEQARVAYDSVMASALKFKKLKILNPFLGNKDLQGSLIADLTIAEDLFKADKNKKDKRIDRIFKGLNKYDRKASNLKLGFNLIRFDRKTSYTENYITHFDKNEVQRRYFYPSYAKLTQRKFLWGFSKFSRSFSVSALLPLNNNGEVTTLSDYGTSMDIREKRVWGWEQKQAKRDLIRAISPKIQSKIDFGDWKKQKKRYNTRFFYQIFFHKNALNTWSKYSLPELKTKLNEYLKTIPLPEPINNGDDDYFEETWEEENSYRLKKMTKKLHQIFQNQNSSKSFKNSILEFLKLRKNIAFAIIGNGFLISLLDQENLENEVFVTFQWSAKDTKALNFSFGNHPKSDLYKELEYVQSILNNRSFDLRINQKENNYKEETRNNLFEELYSK